MGGIRQTVLWLPGLICCLGMLLPGCKTQRQIGIEEPLQPTLECLAMPPLEARGCAITVGTASGSLSANGDIYLDGDSLVYFRATFLVELARGLITRDSFALINRLERSYILEPLPRLNALMPFPLSSGLPYQLLSGSPCLESWLLGQASQQISEGDSTRISLRNGGEATIRKQGRQLTSLKFSTGNASAMITYDRYRASSKGTLLPTRIYIKAQSETGKALDITLEIGQWVEGIKKPVNFAIPSGYKRDEL